jgi:hypothetical protein
MEPTIFAAFSNELRHIQAAGPDMPHDYLETRAAAISKFAMAMPAPGLATRAAGWVGQHRDTLTHGAELAGLGILAKPTIDEMRGKHPTEQAKHRSELGGLATLAAPSAITLGSHLLHRP